EVRNQKHPSVLSQTGTVTERLLCRIDLAHIATKSRVTVTAVKTEVKMPMLSVTAKPRTGPDPNQNMMIAATSVVSCESAMVTMARLKPASMAAMGDLPVLSSSRMRS